MLRRERWVHICEASALSEREFLTLDVLHGGDIVSCLVFRYQGMVYAYRNQCVHMVRRLDGEQKRIFDDAGELLRCSMHGIVYQPQTGESLSTMCRGEKLTPVKITEHEGGIYITDKRVRGIV
ncbi:MAG: (2Fe-2S)-binding protein [Zetaproteobacteria bacterium CG06_land_8_20_14_3_00_59_53]|nr:MAG: (2Fe-2S)-binding protein [Zetaproteobacteria bacterium CG2_30_59_37]PIO90535.1 MAG: (2Fe-2S)-binding protein [Zetaproteobacteria bacterium CG23_combo_of_CG06-09_8_20_14_all_59_86]PIQ66004.1 MAG: (2Fe-2S)-binding protein [Zetaproteobacteria bacterium CG11_big_fil_rev_8_21_14_0_20_59_439]PIU71484.1 MAG: (2Fe-2S)-binding protein [Zetaproteobacteria bacterium CG06_land_8_20_14_3_00_59_53]PIU97742.1 MAG: (2Fe-2S)-binding protein [Zetaproteobacteria bacterium CG03_land_8_20_14_0_80_59_51]PIY